MLPSPFDEEETVVPGVHFSEEYSHGWDDLQRGHNYSGKEKLSENMAKVIEAWLNGAIAPNANNNRLPVYHRRVSYAELLNLLTGERINAEVCSI